MPDISSQQAAFLMSAVTGTIRGRHAILVTKGSLIAGAGSYAINYSELDHGYGPHFRACDKASGEVVADVLCRLASRAHR